ncbi:leucyl aminopeptidase [Corynebacterium sp. CCM 8835]|uniref:Probable cytosol aminopeptidase n=1 Tax=Corynebacterium antarcticum TaxID=2800405 RepID=A0ABS1FJ80_9CORY|nr:leucyl aminopeptidase [Corynebacterium antarcticum]MCL0245071.1 leucyl aminopeptidase [Corynebacterium antarcticum]MCX7539376.1 leucyl aminopeptidase [Corynebacterium antarcticum]
MSATFTLPARGSTPVLSLAKKISDDTDALLVAVFEGEEGLELAATGLFDDEVEIAVWQQLAAVGATGAKEEITRVPGLKATGVGTVVAVGLGDPDDLSDDRLRRAAGVAARSLRGFNRVATTIGAFGLRAAVEGVSLGAYDYRGLKTDEVPERKRTVGEVVFLGGDKKEFVAAQITAEAVILARDLVNTPSSHLYPESYAEIAAKEAGEHGVKVEILDDKRLLKDGYGGIMAVGQGSTRKPRLLRLTWSTRKASKSVALVGKGITFDTGGISIKPSSNMDHMISDMGGSAAVIASVIAAARLNLRVNVTATVPLAENMPGGGAYRPGDVVTHYGGTTSEIINTDAEGRMILADAIARACEDDPDYLIETATLTGAQLVALGARTAGVMGSPEFRDRIAAHGRTVGEEAWAMPIPEDVADGMKSTVADLRNVNPSRNGGMLGAAHYLSTFVTGGVEWAHIDVAGPAFNTDEVWGCTPKRATGVPVRTIVDALTGIADE